MSTTGTRHRRASACRDADAEVSAFLFFFNSRAVCVADATLFVNESSSNPPSSSPTSPRRSFAPPLATRNVMARERTDAHAHWNSSSPSSGSPGTKSNTAAATSQARNKSARASSAASTKLSGIAGAALRNVASSMNRGDSGRDAGSASTYKPKFVRLGWRRASATKRARAVSSETSAPRVARGADSYAAMPAPRPSVLSARAAAASNAVHDAGRVSTVSPDSMSCVATRPLGAPGKGAPTATLGLRRRPSAVAHATSAAAASSTSAAASGPEAVAARPPRLDPRAAVSTR
mmetsp:Transcript_8415/g.35220  ORF Transcript_8415/g.35220 Transcript_8415/m.35220 type:complete len:291 (-) Transcript_8415:122-994(-)